MGTMRGGLSYGVVSYGNPDIGDRCEAVRNLAAAHRAVTACVHREDDPEGRTAFMEKRTPLFTGHSERPTSGSGPGEAW